MSYKSWVRVSTVNSNPEHRVHADLAPFRIYFFLLWLWETTIPLSTTYLLISSTLEYADSGFRVTDPYYCEEQTY